MSNRILVVGGDKSALEVAINARISNPDSEIKIIIPHDSFPYLGFGISDLVGMDIEDFEMFRGHTIDCYKNEFGIEIMNDHDIVSINAGEKKAIVSNQKGKLNFQLEYEKLILALGGTAMYPLVEGRGLKNVFFEEYPKQTIDILKLIQDGKVRQAIVVGGSMKGIETAVALWDMDINVTLVEQEKHLLPELGAQIGDKVCKLLLEKGMNIVMGEPILTLIGNPMGEVVEVHTPERILPCDLAIWITHREPSISFANEIGLSLDSRGAIRTDKDLETNLSNIYAVGNCAAPDHPCPAICNTLISRIFDINISKTGFSLDEAINHGYHAQSVLITAHDNPICYQKSSTITANFVFDSHNVRLLGAQFLSKTPLEKLIDLTASFITMEIPIEDIIRVSSSTTSSRIMAKAGYAIISKLEEPDVEHV